MSKIRRVRDETVRDVVGLYLEEHKKQQNSNLHTTLMQWMGTNRSILKSAPKWNSCVLASLNHYSLFYPVIQTIEGFTLDYWDTIHYHLVYQI